VQVARTATVRRDTAIGAGTVIEDGATVRCRLRGVLVAVLAIYHARPYDRSRVVYCWRHHIGFGNCSLRRVASRRHSLSVLRLEQAPLQAGLPRAPRSARCPAQSVRRRAAHIG